MNLQQVMSKISEMVQMIIIANLVNQLAWYIYTHTQENYKIQDSSFTVHKLQIKDLKSYWYIYHGCAALSA